MSPPNGHRAVVTREQLQALAGTVPLVKFPPVTAGHSLDVGEWLARHGVDARGPVDWSGS